ncbi:MAG: carboxypeptidase M32 [Defluviitaleaceae bacterium]|nr:carboxypeptidase M32 [Defluviitaleaceae bacterium]
MHQDLNQTITDFKAYLERMTMFGQAMSIIGYDAETIAPPGGIAMRAKRAGFFGLEVFNMSTSSVMKGFLDTLTPHLDTLDKPLQAMVRKCKKSYDAGTKIPPEKVREFAALRTEAGDVWVKARQENNFAMFAPYLKRLIDMSKELLALRADELPAGGVPYDIFLDDYEEGMTVAKYDDFFNKLKAVVVPLIKQIAQSGKKIDRSFASAKVETETQRVLSKMLAEKIGYDLTRGYIGETVHPFCTGPEKTDVRITTRYDENDFLSSLYSILHECGHAIYEQNIADDIANTTLGTGTSMGIHESQSRFYENVIGRSPAFWEYITDDLKAVLPKSFGDVTSHMFFEAVNESKPSLIRVEADELTYSLHVIIRYEIEKMIFAGEVAVDDLPALWNAKYQEYLGVSSPTDADGVLQDIHWSMGAFGYFPTYALGSAYAAQLLHYMKKDMDVDALVAKGDFAKITGWLTEKIHRYGSIYTPNELMAMNFGEELNGEYFAEYLRDKFEKLYSL